MKKILILSIICCLRLVSQAQTGMAVGEVMSLANKLSGVADQLDVLVNIDDKMESLERIEKARDALKDASDYYNDVKYLTNTIVLIETTACALKDLDKSLNAYYNLDNLRDNQACYTGIDYEYILAQGQAIDDMLTAIMEKNKYSAHERDLMGFQIPESIKALGLDVAEFKQKVDYEIASAEKRKWEEENYVGSGVAEIEIDFQRVDINNTQDLIFILIKIALAVGLIPVVVAASRTNFNPLYVWLGALGIATVLERVLG